MCIPIFLVMLIAIEICAHLFGIFIQALLEALFNTLKWYWYIWTVKKCLGKEDMSDNKQFSGKSENIVDTKTMNKLKPLNSISNLSLIFVLEDSNMKCLKVSRNIFRWINNNAFKKPYFSSNFLSLQYTWIRYNSLCIHGISCDLTHLEHRIVSSTFYFCPGTVYCDYCFVKNVFLSETWFLRIFRFPQDVIRSEIQKFSQLFSRVWNLHGLRIRLIPKLLFVIGGKLNIQHRRRSDDFWQVKICCFHCAASLHLLPWQFIFLPWAWLLSLTRLFFTYFNFSTASEIFFLLAEVLVYGSWIK